MARRSAWLLFVMACAASKPRATPRPCVTPSTHPCASTLTTRLRGCLVDAVTGAPIEGAAVRVTAAGGPAVTTTSDARGEWGVDADGADFEIGVYYLDIAGDVLFHVPGGAPPYQVPTLAISPCTVGEATAR